MTDFLGNRRWSTERWEEHIGDQIRRARLNERLSQQALADKANVNRNSVSSLERGEGSSLATLIKVLRVLERTDWLNSLAPDPGPSPLEKLRQQQKRDGKRVRTGNPRGEAT